MDLKFYDKVFDDDKLTSTLKRYNFKESDIEGLFLCNNPITSFENINKQMYIPQTIPIRRLTNLTELCIQYYFFYMLPDVIFLLAPTLKVLDFKRNNLKFVQPKINLLINLENLDLSYNNISVLPTTLRVLTNLQYLCLEQNKLLPEKVSCRYINEYDDPDQKNHQHIRHLQYINDYFGRGARNAVYCILMIWKRKEQGWNILDRNIIMKIVNAVLESKDHEGHLWIEVNKNLEK